ncbi:hypothetical protein ANN_20201 [Periplaneta americana]|uniref:Uncharacterized protein n=1 Tax=Periplaneta americana TaxID=6978 RepID=A0ABQ8SD53_PERAM|nr:hypothetical protein ANN_20201 [Periplaneta americana]
MYNPSFAIRLPNLDTVRETTLKYTDMPEEDAKKNTGHHTTRQNDKRNITKTDEHYCRCRTSHGNEVDLEGEICGETTPDKMDPCSHDVGPLRRKERTGKTTAQMG